jgi:uncharacterized protein
MKTSLFLQVIPDTVSGSGKSICFHSLLGNLFVLDSEHTEAVYKYMEAKTSTEEVARSPVLSALAGAQYLEKDQADSRRAMAEMNAQWLKSLAGGGRLTMLNLIVSEACNFACPQCLHRCNVETNANHGTKKLMSKAMATEAINKYFDLIRLHDHQAQTAIHFGSAEPLLNWEVVSWACVYARSIDPNVRLSINTNLSLLTPEIAKFLAERKVTVVTSLDGPPVGNNAIRFYRDGRGTFDDIMAGFTMMEEAGAPLDGFSITINDLNFDSIDQEFFDWIVERGFTSIATDIDLINMKNANHTVEECVQKLVWFRRQCRRAGIENNGSWTTAYDYLVNGNEDGVSTFCRAVRGKNVSINPEGTAFICGHTTTVIGDLSNFEEIFAEGSDYVSLVTSRMPGADIECFGCSIEGLCSGQCHITREMAHSTGNGRMNYLCEFNRQVTFALLADKLQEEL